MVAAAVMVVVAVVVLLVVEESHGTILGLRIARFCRLLNRHSGPTDGRMDGPTDGRTYGRMDREDASKNGKKRETTPCYLLAFLGLVFFTIYI